jgi:two-component system, LytTR family, sensor kinase
MRVRWREQEIIFVSILVVMEILSSTVNPLLQICTVLLFFGIYLCINWMIIPTIKKISFSDVEKLFTLNLLRPFLMIVVTSFVFALGHSILIHFAKPHLINYRGYQLLALFGYNDKTNFLGYFRFDKAIVLILIFTALAGLRELIIWRINKPDASREFRVMVANNLIPVLFAYFLFLYFTDPVHATFLDYFAWFTPALAVYIYLSFWLFPFGEKYKWWQKPVLARLLVATFAGAVFSSVFYSGGEKWLEFSIYWLFLLLVVTPLSRLLYQQRRDKILQLKGMEAALAKSASDLQFLRSQINPHFLFNALNTLYGTALKEKSEQTATGIQKLGDMMRFMLHENNLDFISLDKEVEYLKNYIALQKLRIPASAGIRIEHNIDEVACNRQIAPMLLIPFVENAFKHGISLREKSWIDIKLECNENYISFEVRNSKHSQADGDTEKDKSGIGLKNVAERLRLLYAGKHELQLNETENEFVVKLLVK